jgi:glutaconate CoA-transferase subunit B
MLSSRNANRISRAIDSSAPLRQHAPVSSGWTQHHSVRQAGISRNHFSATEIARTQLHAHPSQPHTEFMTGPSESRTDSRGYTFAELMVSAAAREISDGELVFVGMRLPMLAFNLARRTHAPGAVGLFENGIIRETPSPELLYTMGDCPNLRGASQCGEMLSVMGLLQQGRVNVGFLGAAEVDRFGNLNTTWGFRHKEMQRLPGSGGACDIACLAQRTVVMLAHDRGRLSDSVGHITSPGFGTGNSWRRAQGLPAISGPSAIITTLGVLRFGHDGETYLASVHPGVSVEEVLANTGWTLRVADELTETPAPSKEDLQVIRQLDPNRFWTH